MPAASKDQNMTDWLSTIKPDTVIGFYRKDKGLLAMATFFGYEFNMPSLQNIFGAATSSSCARNAGRLNLGAQVLGSSLSIIPGSNIPAKFSQILISGFTSIRPETHVPERLLHILQALIAATEMGLEITLLFQNQQCHDLTYNICKAAYLTKLLYAGILTTGQVFSEISKDPYVPNTQDQEQQTEHSHNHKEQTNEAQHDENRTQVITI
ncbi:hypothetical protein [Legionella londiniensis]|nr:hypothetical protein [Legionella londiniensis]